MLFQCNFSLIRGKFLTYNYLCTCCVPRIFSTVSLTPSEVFFPLETCWAICLSYNNWWLIAQNHDGWLQLGWCVQLLPSKRSSCKWTLRSGLGIPAFRFLTVGSHAAHLAIHLLQFKQCKYLLPTFMIIQIHGRVYKLESTGHFM
jgi:hypothetical protein